MPRRGQNIKTMSPDFGFCIKPISCHNDGDGTVYLWIEYQGATRLVPTRYEKIRTLKWDTASRSIVPCSEATGHSLLNALTRDLRLVEDIVHGFKNYSGQFTVDDVVNDYCNAVSGIRMFGIYATMLAEELYLAGHGRTARAYLNTIRRLAAFNGGCDVETESITAQMIHDFRQSLINEGVRPNTVKFYIHNLRAIYNKAVREGLVPQSPDSPFDTLCADTSLVRNASS